MLTLAGATELCVNLRREIDIFSGWHFRPIGNEGGYDINIVGISNFLRRNERALAEGLAQALCLSFPFSGQATPLAATTRVVAQLVVNSATLSIADLFSERQLWYFRGVAFHFWLSPGEGFIDSGEAGDEVETDTYECSHRSTVFSCSNPLERPHE